MSAAKETDKDRALALLRRYGAAALRAVREQSLVVQAERVEQIVRMLQAPHALLLGDPVGTGKTAVALTAAKVLLDRGGVCYVLIVVPNALVAKLWQERAGYLDFKPAQSWRRDALRIVTKRNIPKSPSPEPAATLIIVDESHRGLQNDQSPCHQRLRPIARGTRLLLVSATPFQLSTSGFLNMLLLSEPEDPNGRRPAISSYGSKLTRLLRECHRSRGDGAEDRVSHAIRAARQHQRKARLALKAHMLDAYPQKRMGIPSMPLLAAERVEKAHADWMLGYQVARIVPELVSRSGDMFQRRLLSSNRAFWEGDAGAKLAMKCKSNDALRALQEQLRQHLGDEVRHPKVAATVAWVTRRVKAKRHVLLFCTFEETQQVLAEVLRDRLGDDKVYAPDTAAHLKHVKKRFCSPKGPPLVLVVRDNLSESIDLDGGQPCLVHHDLTWNPARMAQRWGRVVRISTNFEAVRPEDIYCPVLALEADQRLYDTVRNRSDLVNLLLPSDHEKLWHALPTEVLERLRQV